MRKESLRLIIGGLFLLPVLAFGQTGDFKNPAGAAAEIAAMRQPAPSSVGVRSKSAMLPIETRGGKWTTEFPIETSGNLRLTLIAPNADDWQILVKTGAETINLRDSNSNLNIEKRTSEIGLDGVRYPAEVFAFDYAATGNWRVEISGASESKDARAAGYLVVTTDSPYQVYGWIDTAQTIVGNSVGIRASIFDARTAADGGQPSPLRRVGQTMTAEIRQPDGSIRRVDLRDGGAGVFAADFVPRSAGQYFVQTTVKGISPKGEEFIRTNEQIFQVVTDRANLGAAARTSMIDNERLQVSVPTGGLSAGRKVIAYAEIWGRDAAGKQIAAAWFGGMAIAEGGAAQTNISLIFDTRWLGLSGAVSDFELRNIRLQDADYFVTLGVAERIAVTLPVLPAENKSFRGEPTEDMRMGKRPGALNSPDAAGGKLMLVHGYCAGGNPFPTSQFSNYIVFSDPNKNRTHDQFANLIKNFGAAYPSFGIVAHSQGGAASLHLYTYYWSGLDSATGSRLIQSVGTPYQGTALAGNLAALGSVFGAGCGANNDLSYSGAANWLANIPTWARAKVSYSTTSFTDVWYRYDYCNVATDLFLSDPDDGVTEKTYDQLPGAINRGHKTGWCHTSGMRDPAQTSDSSRNADMNANAAR